MPQHKLPSGFVNTHYVWPEGGMPYPKPSLEQDEQMAVPRPPFQSPRSSRQSSMSSHTSDSSSPPQMTPARLWYALTAATSGSQQSSSSSSSSSSEQLPAKPSQALIRTTQPDQPFYSWPSESSILNHETVRRPAASPADSASTGSSENGFHISLRPNCTCPMCVVNPSRRLELNDLESLYNRPDDNSMRTQRGSNYLTRGQRESNDSMKTHRSIDTRSPQSGSTVSTITPSESVSSTRTQRESNSSRSTQKGNTTYRKMQRGSNNSTKKTTRGCTPCYFWLLLLLVLAVVGGIIMLVMLSKPAS